MLRFKNELEGVLWLEANAQNWTIGEKFDGYPCIWGEEPFARILMPYGSEAAIKAGYSRWALWDQELEDWYSLEPVEA